jgi:hypothetical protein
MRRNGRVIMAGIGNLIVNELQISRSDHGYFDGRAYTNNGALLPSKAFYIQLFVCPYDVVACQLFPRISREDAFQGYILGTYLAGAEVGWLVYSLARKAFILGATGREDHYQW